MREFNRKFKLQDLSLQGELEGYCPVQGYGTILGYPFYFRARYDQWSFAIAEYPDIDPVDIQLPESAKQYGFFKEGVVGKEWEYLASYMELSEAEAVFIACCQEYLSTKAKN